MAELIVCEEHSQVYDTWVERGLSNLNITHVDFHCDMRGLLIDRPRSRARFINELEVDSGNFIAHGIMNKMVSSVTWVHDKHGGRRYDVGTVKYEADLSIFRHRFSAFKENEKWMPVEFKELTFDNWDNNLEGQQLDIDWDGIASIDYSMSHIEKLTNQFLARDFNIIPEITFLVYSPGYAHPNRDLYERFIEKLAVKFGADVNRLPLPKLRPGYPKPPQDLTPAERGKYKLVRALHDFGIY